MNEEMNQKGVKSKDEQCVQCVQCVRCVQCVQCVQFTDEQWWSSWCRTRLGKLTCQLALPGRLTYIHQRAGQLHRLHTMTRPEVTIRADEYFI